MSGSPSSALLGGLFAALLFCGCADPSGPAPDADEACSPAQDLFCDRAPALGIDFVHFNGMSGEYYFSEIVGPGGAFVDFDGDGDLDLYLVQGAMLGPGKKLNDALFPLRAGVPLSNRLLRNDLVESGSLGFTDITATMGIESDGYGMGVAAGDYDNDGDVDLYVTNYGPNRMLRNEGDGTFSDVTAASRTEETRWSTSAAFLDYDRDGRLDLYVGNYVDFSFANHKECFAASSARDYCGPLSYDPVPDRLFRNRGDGSFDDVSASSHIVREFGGALGVIATDADGDGWIDIYVANDGLPNQLWINRRDGRFENNALLAGCAYNEEGKAEASMGVDAGDFDNDGDEDLFMTHLTDETNTLYVNDGRGMFRDQTLKSGLGVSSRAFTGFGTAWIDYDNDGRLDLLIGNGAVKSIEEQARQGHALPLKQTNQLFRNLGDGRFEETTAAAGPVFSIPEVSRGLAVGDVDNDGDSDVLMLQNAGPARLLLNNSGNRNAWLGLRLVGGTPPRDLYGAEVALVFDDGRTLTRRVRAAASYCSSNDPRVLFGLGGADAVARVEVRWPGGGGESWDWAERPIRQYHTLVEGTGQRRSER